MVTVNLIKATMSGAAFAAGAKFITSNDMKESIAGGAVVASSVVLVDAAFTMMSGVPAFFNVLGSYAMDVVSSIIAAIILTFGHKYAQAIPSVGLVPGFLLALGGTVLATYAEGPFRDKLPSIMGVQLG